MLLFAVGLALWLVLLVGAWGLVGRSLESPVDLDDTTDDPTNQDENHAVDVHQIRPDAPPTPRASTLAALCVGLIGLLAATPSRAQPTDSPRPRLRGTHDDSVRTVSFSEALRLFRTNNLSLQRAQAAVRAMKGEARQTAAYPNPRLQATHEPLWRNGTHQSETYLNVSQRVAWSGRSARIEASRRRVDAVQARTAADSARLAVEVATTYAEAAAAAMRLRRLERVTRVFRRADSSFAAREAEGEASGYARRRVRLERARYEQRLAAARLNVQSARQRLSLLILPDEAPAVAAEALPGAVPPPMSEREALRTASRQRPELRRWRSEVDAAHAAFRADRRSPWPDPSVTAGYKRQSDGFEGAFLGVTLPLPVFDRHRGAAEAESARLDAAQTQRTLARRTIRNEVRRAHSAYVSARRQSRLVGPSLMAESDDLLRIAQTSYREGEMSLVELLDAADAYRDARITTIDLQADLWTRYFALLHAMGRPLTLP